MNFERGKDPKKTLELGMEQVLNEFLKSVSQETNSREHQIHVAVVYGRIDLVGYLLREGIKPTYQLLLVAINIERPDIIKLLLEYDSSLKNRLNITQYKWKKMSPEIKELIS